MKRIILSNKEQADLRKIVTDATAHLQELDRGDKCGLDCGPLREGTQEIINIANNLLQQFGNVRE